MTPNAKTSGIVGRLCAQPGVHLDRNGCVQTNRKLHLDDGPLPLDLIPEKVRRTLSLYMAGQFDHGRRSVLYEARKVLRRYGLLSKPTRTRTPGAPTSGRTTRNKGDAREQRRLYKREWRRRRAHEGYAVL